MTHVRTSPTILNRTEESNVGTSRQSRVPPAGNALSLEDAERLVDGYVEHVQRCPLERAIGYITPKDMLASRQQEIHPERDRKLEQARKQRKIRRQQPA